MDGVSNANEATNTVVDFDSMSAEDFASFDIDKFLSEHGENTDPIDFNQDETPDDINGQDTDNVYDNQDKLDGREDDVDVDNENKDNVDVTNEEENNTDVDIGSELSKILANPIKANGHEIVVDSPDKAVQLMQMGANYGKKMQEIKPHLGLIRALQSAGIADDKQVMNQLIDIAKGDKKALLSFAKSREIDLAEIEDEELDYTPNENISSEEEIAFDEVVSSLKDSPTYEKLTSSISKDFNDDSSNVFYKNPEILRAISSDIETGLYDKVMGMVQSKRLFEKDNRPTIDIYIDAYPDAVKKIKKQTNAKSQRSTASKVSATPSGSKPKTNKHDKVNLEEIDIFSMTPEEADAHYEKYLKDLPL